MAGRNRVVSFKAGPHFYQLRFRHQDLFDMAVASNRDVLELYGDRYRGWPYILLFGLRHKHPKLTIQNCNQIIDEWNDDCAENGNDNESLGFVLLDALKAAGYIKEEKKDDDEDGDEGNAPAPTPLP